MEYFPIHRCRGRAVVVAGMLLMLTACDRSQPAPTAPAPPPVAAAEVAAQKDAKLPEATRAWWNQEELVTELRLTDAQRTQMDAILQQSLDAQRAAQEKQRAAQKALDEAIATGDWRAARTAAAALASPAGALWTVQATLRVDELAQLAPEQRQTLVTQYPQATRTVYWRPRPPRPRGNAPK